MNIDLLSYKPKATAARLILLAALAFLILVLFGQSLFPFHHYIGYDVTVFKLMGVAWREGYIPYHNFFDHKGPLHYIIQLLAFSISDGKVGLLLLETLNAVAIFELLYRCGKELGAKTWLNLLSLFVGINLFAVLIGSGDTVEEWSLPYQILPLLLAIKYLKGRYSSTPKLALLCGLCFGATAMIRINDNCTICGIVIGLAIVLLSNKAYKELFACIGYFLIGMIATILPFVVYFYINDALSDMIYCNLTFNLHYKSNPHFSTTVIRPLIVLQLIQCLILPVTSWRYDRTHNTRMFPMMTAMSLLAFYMFLFSAGFEHYFLMVMPLAALCILTCSGTKAILPLLLSLVLLSPIATIEVYRHKYVALVWPKPVWTWNFTDNDCNRDIISRIPQHEQDSIYVYGGNDFGYLGELLHHRILPVGKYTFLQDVLYDVDAETKQAIQESFNKANPIWIISSKPAHQMKALKNVDRMYEFKYQEENYYIYRRK